MFFKYSRLLLLSSFFLFTAPFSVNAADYDSIEIYPQKVGLIYNAPETNPSKTQQYTAWGIKNGERVKDITNEVDWYIDPAGYPLFEQPKNHVTAKIDIDTGLATALNSWGRVVVHACYPKGCASGSFGSFPAMGPILDTLLKRERRD